MIRRLFAAIIALIAWAGLAVQFDATLGSLGSVAETLWAMLLYFTILANLAVAIIFTAMAVGCSKLGSPFLLGGVTITMLLVGVVYNMLLSGMYELSGGAKLADFLNHIVTPITVGCFWLFWAEKGYLGRWAPLQWALVPLLYFIYALMRGSTGGKYPYPFMDLARIGWTQTILNALVMAAGFAAVGFAMLWWDSRSAPKRGGR